MALVMPENVVAEMSVENVIDNAQDDITRNVFRDVDAAKTWLASR